MTAAVFNLSGVHSRVQRKVRLIGFALTLICLSLGVATPQARSAGDENQTSCPAATEVSPGFRAYLPDCRAYEIVSPPFKGGWRVFASQFSFDGSSVIGSSFGSFAGATSSEGVGDFYRFARDSSTWTTTPLNPPLPQFGEMTTAEFFTGPDVSSSGAALFVAHTSTQSVYEGDLYLREPDGSFVPVGPMLPAAAIPSSPTGTNTTSEGERIAGTSADLSHILFSITSGASLPPGITTNLWPGDNTVPENTSLYEYLGAGHTGVGGDLPELVGVDNGSSQISQCGTAAALDPTTLAAGISSGGSTVVFTAAPGGCAAAATGPTVGQLYARIGAPGSRQATVNLAGTSGCAASEACNVTVAPTYQGSSADGSKVFFTTTQALSPTDIDAGNDIYECELPGDGGALPTPDALVDPCPSLRPVSVTGSSSGAEVQSVVAISEDGSHVYFVANGVLTSTPNVYGATAALNANNLYVYERDGAFPAGHISFIGALSSSSPRAQVTPNGRFLVFTDAADLTPDDTSTALQVFEYDAQSGSLVRVSIGDQGFNDDGNTNVDNAELPEAIRENINQSGYPGVSSDGSEVVFTSADGLTPQALDSVVSEGIPATNVYEYSGGRVFLISDGRATIANQPTSLAGISASGRDIFFLIADQLVPQDTDQLYDIYDARVDGGFPPPVVPIGCEGDACQGTLGVAPQLSLAGSSTQAGGGNLAAPVEVKSKSKPKKKASTKKKKKKQKRHTRKRRVSAVKRAGKSERRDRKAGQR